MSTVPAPTWNDEQLEVDRARAIADFRKERMREPLEDYLEAFDQVRSSVEDLLEATVDLSELHSMASEILSEPGLLEAVRYLPGPPISEDDLKVLAEASLARTRLRSDPDMARRVVETILYGLDRARFPWVSEDREPTDAEREVARIATAALIAQRRVFTARQNQSKDAQEDWVAQALIEQAQFTEVPTREIYNVTQAPSAGEFCRESLFCTRKADLVVRLWDGRVMPIECKVSNSSTNSVKRLNNDAAAKAATWVREFGAANAVPSAVLSGVYKRNNLKAAQGVGLTLWWAHSLERLTKFIEATKG